MRTTTATAPAARPADLPRPETPTRWWNASPQAAAAPARHVAARPDIGAFVFDVDGVLADTAELHWRAWRQVASEEGIDVDPALQDALRGIPREASLRMILGDRVVSTEKFHEMMNRKNERYLASLATLGPASALPGAADFLLALARRGIRLAAASASRNAQYVLERIGLLERFAVVIDGRTPMAPKPAPELFLKAATRLRVSPGRCVVVEDAPAGVAAARAGGMRSIGIGPPGLLCAATVVVQSLAGLNPAILLDRLRQVRPSATPIDQS